MVASPTLLPRRGSGRLPASLAADARGFGLVQLQAVLRRYPRTGTAQSDEGGCSGPDREFE